MFSPAGIEAKGGSWWTERSDRDQEDEVAHASADRVPPTLGGCRWANLTLDCHVLDDGSRVLPRHEIVRALRGTSGNLFSIDQCFAALPNYRPGMFDERKTRVRVGSMPPSITAFHATVLTDLGDMYITAGERGALNSEHRYLVRQSWMIARASLPLGIDGLIDEVTGYREAQRRRALRRQLESTLIDGVSEWGGRLPDDFWEVAS
jgi:hypothetical protein